MAGDTLGLIGPPSMAVPALRRELEFHEPINPSDEQLVLEDPVRARFYRIGRRERALMTQLDGRLAPHAALAAANQRLAYPLSPDEATAIVSFLAREGLLVSEGEQARRQTEAVRRLRRLSQSVRALNALFFRVPLLNPDRFLGAALPYARWLVSPAALLVTVGLWLSAVYPLTQDSTALTEAFDGLFYPHNWLWFLLVYLMVKVLHELAHGLVSKAYGGQVYEAGVLLVLFIPIGYVDATQSWRFANRWQKMHVAAAGMIAELSCAAIAAWIWAGTPEGPVRDLAFKVVLIGGFATLVFNANPLMRFDGYFLLSDLVGIPNLYQRGQAFLGHLGRRWFLAMDIGWESGFSGWRDLFIKGYGVAAWLWRLFVMVVILVAASKLLGGVGIVFAITTVVAMLIMPMLRVRRLFGDGVDPGSSESGGDRVFPNPRRFVPRLVLIAAGLVTVALVPSWSPSIEVPAVVDHRDRASVRASSPGMVSHVLVDSGQVVDIGEPLVQLDNPALQAEKVSAKARLTAAELVARSLLRNGEQAAYLVEQRRAQALRERWLDLSRRIDELTIRAERAGTVLARHPESLVGTYAHSGRELLSVVDNRKELVLSIAESDFSRIPLATGNTVQARFPGRGREEFTAVVTRISPRASIRLDFPMLSAANDGPIPVKSRTDPGEDELVEDRGHFDAVEAQVVVAADLGGEAARRLWAGEVGRVKLSGFAQSPGERLHRLLGDWLDELNRQW